MTMSAILKLAFDGSSITDDLAPALARVGARFDEQLISRIEPVNSLCQYIERYRGKMLRPTLVFLAGMTAHPHDDGEPRDELITIAAVLEMIHMATLVHDDVLDDAAVRRGSRTVNAMSGNETAVILGDYLLSRSYHLCSQLDTQSTALRVGEITAVVCEGEMLQLAHRGRHDLTEETYMKIIERKTAALIAGAMELGASHAGASDEAVRAMREIGLKLGTAFQIQDDLLDITGNELAVGKTLGRDMDKGKLTLPIIHHLSQLDADQRDAAIEFFSSADTNDPSVRGAIVDAMHETGSIVYAREKAVHFVSGAKAALASFPPSPSRDALFAAADSVINREY